MGLCLLRFGNRPWHLRHGLNLRGRTLLTSTLFASTINEAPNLLDGIVTKAEAEFVVAVPGRSTFQLACFLGLTT